MNADKNKDDFADDLLVKYLLGEADATEKIKADQWINASPEHKKHFEQLGQVWQMSGMITANSPSEEEAWARFRRLVPSEKKSRPQPHLSLKKWVAAAAVLCVVVSGAWMWYRHNYSSAGLLTIASKNTPLTDTLIDKTVVTLNKNSTLSYRSQFGSENRVVQLQGEAFFNVTQQQNHPFIVHVNDITVTVLGTSFNINEAKGTVEVIVKTGSVKVTGKKDEVQLHSGEKVVVSDNGAKLQKEKTDDELYNYYSTQEFVCNNTPLSELVSALNKAYDSRIRIANPQLENLRITTTFHRSQPLDTILAIISQTFSQVTYSKENNRIILK